MPTSIAVILIEVEYAMDMQVVIASPGHEHSHYIGCFLGIVDVVHQIPQSVYDNQSITCAFSECIIN